MTNHSSSSKSRDSGISPLAKNTINGLWSGRHQDLQRKLLRASIHDAQKWRKLFRKLPKQTGK